MTHALWTGFDPEQKIAVIMNAWKVYSGARTASFINLNRAELSRKTPIASSRTLACRQSSCQRKTTVSCILCRKKEWQMQAKCEFAHIAHRSPAVLVTGVRHATVLSAEEFVCK